MANMISIALRRTQCCIVKKMWINLILRGEQLQSRTDNKAYLYSHFEVTPFCREKYLKRMKKDHDTIQY